MLMLGILITVPVLLIITIIDVVDGEKTGMQNIDQSVSIFAARSNDQRQQGRMRTQMRGGAHDGEVSEG